ncbi:universal stress protein [Streptomyces sp. NPDC056061]|uniref:universal stress protein n=1 Tax=Streptomyces sp. NPDC056061 TaxID=3345700 RepID=UPI0035DE68DE
MNQRIVVGVDGSAQSAAASHWAAREALLHRSSLHLVHVEEGFSALNVRAARSDLHHAWVRDLLDGISEELLEEHPRLRISSESLDGRPADALARAARSASMLVLGSHGRGTLMGFVLGSVGLAVLRTTRRPVVLVRGPENTPPHTRREHFTRGVVVGIDIGHPCDALLAFAFAEASCRGCTLVPLYGWSPPQLAGSGMAYSPALNARLTREAASGLERVLGPYRKRNPTVTVEARAVAGRPSVQLLDACAEADLVAVGRRIHRSPTGGDRIGPVTHAVLHHCTAPVAVIAHT